MVLERRIQSGAVVYNDGLSLLEIDLRLRRVLGLGPSHEIVALGDVIRHIVEGVLLVVAQLVGLSRILRRNLAGGGIVVMQHEDRALGSLAPHGGESHVALHRHAIAGLVAVRAISPTEEDAVLDASFLESSLGGGGIESGHACSGGLVVEFHVMGQEGVGQLVGVLAEAIGDLRSVLAHEPGIQLHVVANLVAEVPHLVDIPAILIDGTRRPANEALARNGLGIGRLRDGHTVADFGHFRIVNALHRSVDGNVVCGQNPFGVKHDIVSGHLLVEVKLDTSTVLIVVPAREDVVLHARRSFGVPILPRQALLELERLCFPGHLLVVVEKQQVVAVAIVIELCVVVAVASLGALPCVQGKASDRIHFLLGHAVPRTAALVGMVKIIARPVKALNVVEGLRATAGGRVVVERLVARGHRPQTDLTVCIAAVGHLPIHLAVLVLGPRIRYIGSVFSHNLDVSRGIATRAMSMGLFATDGLRAIIATVVMVVYKQTF